jgi:hypothetical protein
MLAVSALIAACGDETPRDRPLGAAVDLKCPARNPSLPTPLPTEQWTREWLSDWSGQLQRSRAKQMSEVADRLVQARTSLRDLKRVPLNVDGAAPGTLNEAIQQADALIVGDVGEQYLARENERGYVMVSEIETEAGVERVSQPVFLDCVSVQAGDSSWTSEIGLGVLPCMPPLKPDVRYAILATRDNAGAWRQISGHAYEVRPDGAIKRRESLALITPGWDITIDDLRERFAAAHS